MNEKKILFIGLSCVGDVVMTSTVIQVLHKKFPQATIDFEVSEPTMVQLNIYNLNGQKVNVLKNAFTLPGYYSVIWNGTNHPSGIYFVILQNSNSIIKQKMMLIK